MKYADSTSFVQNISVIFRVLRLFLAGSGAELGVWAELPGHTHDPNPMREAKYKAPLAAYTKSSTNNGQIEVSLNEKHAGRGPLCQIAGQADQRSLELRSTCHQVGGEKWFRQK